MHPRTARRRACRSCTRLLLVLAAGGALPATGCRDAVGDGGASSGAWAWRAPIEGPQYWFGTPALDGTRLFVEIWPHVVALDARTGATLWRQRVTSGDDPLATNFPVRDGVVFVAETDGIFAFDAATGAQRWHVRTDSSAAGSENLVDDRALYVGTRAHRVHALATDDGRTRWVADVGAGWQYPGSVQGISRSHDTLFVSVTRRLDGANDRRSGVIVALDRRDGHELWRFETATSNSGFDDAPRIWGDLLLASDVDGGAFIGIDRRTGRQRWRLATAAGYLGPGMSPLVVGDVAYGAGYDANVYALRPGDGTLYWTVFTGATNTHLAACGARLLAQSQGIIEIDPGTRRIAGTRLDGASEFTTSGFAISGRRAFVVGNRAVYAFDCR